MIIGDGAFKDNKDLTDVTIEDGVKEIGKDAFAGATNIDTIRINSAVPPTLGENAFPPQATVVVPETAFPDYMKDEEWRKYIGIQQFEYIENTNEIYLTRYIGTSTDMYVPARYHDKPIYFRPSNKWGDVEHSSILGFSLIFNTSIYLTSMYIEDGFTVIPDHCFQDQQSLKTVRLPNSVSYIGASAFMYCDKMETLNLPDNLVSIGSSAFSFCTAWNASFILPPRLNTIGTNAFFMCKTQGKDLVIPESFNSSDNISPFLFNSSSANIKFNNVWVPESFGQQYLALSQYITEVQNLHLQAKFTIDQAYTAMNIWIENPNTPYIGVCLCNNLLIKAKTPPAITASYDPFFSPIVIWVPQGTSDAYKAAWPQYTLKIREHPDF